MEPRCVSGGPSRQFAGPAMYGHSHNADKTRRHSPERQKVSGMMKCVVLEMLE